MTKEKEYKLTIKQEAFARAYVETGNASEAYRRSYNAENMQQITVTKRASELLARGDIAGMVKTIKDKIAAKNLVTVESLVHELEEARIAALTAESPQSAAAVSATMGKAKLMGLDKQILDLKSSDGSMTPRAALDVSKLSAKAMAEILAAKDASER